MPAFQNFGVDYQRSKTKNQSEIRLLRKAGAPIYIQACFQAGSRYNTIPGVAHFLEHMLVSGTVSYPSKLALSQALEKVGGDFMSTTDADLLKLNIRVPDTKDVPLAISILNEMLTASNFNEEVFDNEKKVILREQQVSLQNQYKQALFALFDRLYAEAELGFKNLGTPESVSNLTLSDIREFYESNITNDKVTYIVSGDVTMETLEVEFSKINLSDKAGTKLPTFLPMPAGEKITFAETKRKDAGIFFATRIDSVSIEELAGLFLIRQFFTGRGSILLDRLRYQKGLVYGGNISLIDFRETTIFGFQTTCAKDKVKMVLDITRDVLEERKKFGFSEEDLVALKIKVNSFYRFNRQTSKEWLEAEAQAVRHIAGDKKDEGLNALTLLNLALEMTPERLTEIYRKLIDPEEMCAVVLGEVSEDNSGV